MLEELEGLIKEFFETQGNEARKKEIGGVLANFRLQPEAWKHTIVFFSQSKSPYVQWYSLSVLEEMIHKSWSHRTIEEKTTLKNFILEFLQTKSREVPPFVFKKMVKILVDIAKQEWPNQFPELLPTIQQMTQNSELINVGLSILMTMCEEFISSRDDVSALRRDELKKLLTEQVPGILSLVKLILDSIYEKLLTPYNLQAPMQSPSGYGSPAIGSFGGGGLGIPGSRPRSSSYQRFGSLGIDSDRFVNTRLLDNTKKQTCTLALEVLLQLFSWISLSDHVNNQLLQTLFKYASLNDDNAVQLGCLAMSCINEMLSKSCIPREFEEYLILIFKNIFAMLKDLTDDNPNKLSSSIEDLDDDYREKFTDFINLFLTQHIKRVESAMNFPVIEFLEQLFRYTFLQPSIEAFQTCLDTWDIFLEYLINKKAETNQLSTDSGEITRYREGMMALLRELLKKIFFKTNGQELNDINDVHINADGETEWDALVKNCVEVIGKLADLFPDSVLDHIYPSFVEDSDNFLLMHQFLEFQNNASVEDKTKMYCIVKDLRTELTIFGRLSELFSNSFESSFASASLLLSRILHIGTYCQQYQLSQQGPQLLKIVMQVFATLQAYCHWLFLFMNAASASPERKSQFETLLTQIVETLVSVLESGVPLELGLVVANFFKSITSNIRCATLISLPVIQKFMGSISSDETQIPLEAKCQCYVAISNILILPYPNIKDNEQGWDVRFAQFNQFIKRFLDTYKELPQFPNFIESKLYLQPEAKQKVFETLKILCALLSSVKNEGQVSKKFVYEAIKDSFPSTLSLFQIYLQENEISELILDFFLLLVDSLRAQIGPTFIAQTINMFLHLLGGDQLTAIFSRNNASGAEVVSKFLTLLKTIIEEPGKSYDAFVPEIITICLKQVYPLLQSQNLEASLQVSPAFYSVISSILDNQWKYFFPGSAVNAQAFQLAQQKSQFTSQINQPQGAKNIPQFTAILEIIVASFRSTDINTFKQNLETLENLNTKRKLYMNEIFRQQMLYPFLEVFLHVLINKTHEILKDEILSTIYNMATIDFNTFYSLFIPRFLEGIPELEQNQKQILLSGLKHNEDLPSFMANLSKLVMDCAYFRKLNTATSLDSFGS